MAEATSSVDGAPVGAVERLAKAMRGLAICGAESAMEAVIRDLLSVVDEEDREAGILSQDPRHAGTPARRVDALAQAAAREGAARRWAELYDEVADRVGGVVYVGEEAGNQTQMIKPRTIVVRFDPLDGTTNAVNIVNTFVSVATVDIILGLNERPRHLAGAIIGGEIDVSWAHWSRNSKQTGAYIRPLGEVFVRSVRAGTGWLRLDVSQDERDTSSVASVAASAKRFAAFSQFRNEVFRKGGVVYHLAGNPLCAALLLGHVGALVETQHVTLHDSALLIPHWLLGGKIDTLDGESFAYLLTYEENAANFDPGAKPIPPYIAYVGSSNPFMESKEHTVEHARVSDISARLPKAAEPRQRLFRSEE